MQNQTCSTLPQFVSSKYHCGLRGFITQHRLMIMIGNYRQYLDVGVHAEALLINLPKSFDIASLNFIY